MNYLKENWLFIVGPLLIILIGVGILLYLSSASDSPEFQYDI